jgi:hypothetical protein
MADADTSSDMKKWLEQVFEEAAGFEERYGDELLESRQFSCYVKGHTALTSQKSAFKETGFTDLDGQWVTIKYTKKLINRRYYSEDAPDEWVQITESKITSSDLLTKTVFRVLSAAEPSESKGDLFSISDNENPLLVRLVREENNDWFGEYVFRVGSSTVLAGLACQVMD